MNITVPAGKEVTVKDAIVFEKEGVVIGRLDIVCDFTNLDPSLHHLAIGLLERKCIRLMMSSDEHIEKMKKISEEYDRKKIRV